MIDDRNTPAVYIAGPMRGIPEFNFPAFFQAEDDMKRQGFNLILNPARRDNERHGTDLSKGNATGDEAQAQAEHGFSLREALRDDTNFICMTATHIYMLRGWEKSAGANAEWALAKALGLGILYQ